MENSVGLVKVSEDESSEQFLLMMWDAALLATKAGDVMSRSEPMDPETAWSELAAMNTPDAIIERMFQRARAAFMKPPA
jgi:hypothetical protein